jgi:hypothetical protein
MISAFKPFFSKNPLSWAIKTGYETVGNKGTPMRIFSWENPLVKTSRIPARVIKEQMTSLKRIILPPDFQ